MAPPKTPLKSISTAEPPQPDAQTKIILNVIDELRRAIDAQGAALLEFSGRFDRRFPSRPVQHGMSPSDTIKAEKILPLVFQLLQDKVFSCASLAGAVVDAQHQRLADVLEFYYPQNDHKKLGRFFSRIAGFPIDSGLAVERVSVVGDTRQLWKLTVIKQP